MTPSANFLKRPGVISWGMLFGQPDQLKQYLLLYDELWVPSLQQSYPSSEEIREWDLDEEHLASLQWLEAQGLLRESPIVLDPEKIAEDEVTAGLLELHDFASARGAMTWETAEEAALEGAAAAFNIDTALSRLTTYLAWKENETLVYPVNDVFQDFDGLPGQLAGEQQVLSVVLKRLPVPSGDLPLEEIVRFKQDEDTQFKFRKFWHWARKAATKVGGHREIEEEIDELTNDYERHLAEHLKKVKHERVEIKVAMPLEFVEDLAKLHWGQAARRLFQLDKATLNAHEAELKLPGQEIAYVTAASRLLASKTIKSQ